MTEKGVLVEIKNNIGTIEITPDEKCSKCCSCGASKKRVAYVDINKIKGAAPGDTVYIEVEEGKLLKLYAVLYGVPLIVFVGAVFAVYSFTRSPIISFLVSAGATLLIFALLGQGIKKMNILPAVHCSKKRT